MWHPVMDCCCENTVCSNIELSLSSILNWVSKGWALFSEAMGTISENCSRNLSKQNVGNYSYHRVWEWNRDQGTTQEQRIQRSVLGYQIQSPAFADNQFPKGFTKCCTLIALLHHSLWDWRCQTETSSVPHVKGREYQVSTKCFSTAVLWNLLD